MTGQGRIGQNRIGCSAAMGSEKSWHRVGSVRETGPVVGFGVGHR